MMLMVMMMMVAVVVRMMITMMLMMPSLPITPSFHLISDAVCNDPSPSPLPPPDPLRQVWVNQDTVVLGTKCNSLVSVNVDTGRQTPIELPAAPMRAPEQAARHGVDAQCGIHSIAVNPSADLLASGYVLAPTA